MRILSNIPKRLLGFKLLRRFTSVLILMLAETPSRSGWERSPGPLRQVGSGQRPRSAVARGLDHGFRRFPPLRQGARKAQPRGTHWGRILLGRVGDDRGDDLPRERSRARGDSVGRRARLTVLRRAQAPLRARHR